MPNWIKNRITLIGSKEITKEAIQKFSTLHPRIIRKTHDESMIICKKIDGDFVGWYDKKTGQFEYSSDRGVKVEGLPDGIEYEYREEFLQMPDFDKVIPQPENIFRGDLGRKEEEMCRREGRPTWYDWNLKNWGTKWNSCECVNPGEEVFIFETAWSAVPAIIQKMSETFPEITIEYLFADEDTGQNTGDMIFKAGNLVEDKSPANGTNRAYEIYLELNPDDEYIKLVDGKYQYVEEDE